MKRWGLISALLLSLGVNIGLLGTLAVHRLRSPEAREHRSAEGERGERRDREARTQRRLAKLARLADRMGLEGAGRERFLVQQRGFHLAHSRDRMQLRQVHAQLRRELTAAEPDRARIEALVGEKSRLYAALERALVGNVLTTREMLDPKQEAVYLEFLSRLRSGRFGDGEPDGRRSRRRRGRGDGF